KVRADTNSASTTTAFEIIGEEDIFCCGDATRLTSFVTVRKSHEGALSPRRIIVGVSAGERGRRIKRCKAGSSERESHCRARTVYAFGYGPGTGNSAGCSCRNCQRARRSSFARQPCPGYLAGIDR